MSQFIISTTDFDEEMASVTKNTVLCLPIPGKGYGLIASRSIAPGEIIISEPAMMRVDVPSQQITEPDLEAAFSRLSKSTRKSIMRLSPNDVTGRGSGLMRIYTSNCFGNGRSCWLYPTVDRINHSCVPNATVSYDVTGEVARVIVEKSIGQGEEVTISYSPDVYDISTATQRAEQLMDRYGFACNCPVCVPGPERGVSDLRRMQISAFRQRLYLQVSDNLARTRDSVDGDGIWIQQVNRNVSARDRALLYDRLAKLEEAEGVPALSTAQSYYRAAESMLERMKAMDSVAILEWAADVRELMEKAIATLESVRPSDDYVVQRMRHDWELWRTSPTRLKIALGFLDRRCDTDIQGWNRTDAFAIHASGGKCRALSRVEFEEMRNGGPEPTTQDDTALVQGLLDEAVKRTTRKSQTSTSISQIGKVLRGASVSRVGKVLGAALACATPLAAYWMMR